MIGWGGLADPEARPTLTVEAATVRGPTELRSRPRAGGPPLVLDEFLAGELFDHRGRSRYQGDDERVFCHPQKGSSLDHKRYARTFRSALARAGITDYVRPFHDGRHSAITNDAAAGNSGLAVMRRAGHSDFRVTQQYLDLAGVEFAEEAERAAARALAHARKPSPVRAVADVIRQPPPPPLSAAAGVRFGSGLRRGNAALERQRAAAVAAALTIRSRR